MQLNIISTPPICYSMSLIAYLEAARKRGTLDVAFGNQLLRAGAGTEVAESAERSGEEVLQVRLLLCSQVHCLPKTFARSL